MTVTHRAKAPSLSSPQDFDILNDDMHNEKGSQRSGVDSSSSSITAFDPNSHADRYHSDEDEDDYSKVHTPFLRREDEEAAPPKKAAPEHVTWMSLPHKGQLLILFLCRMVDFLQVATLQAYIFYQLKHMAEQQTLETEGTGTFCLGQILPHESPPLTSSNRSDIIRRPDLRPSRSPHRRLHRRPGPHRHLLGQSRRLA